MLALEGYAFPGVNTAVAPGEEMLVVGTSGGLAELERRASAS